MTDLEIMGRRIAPGSRQQFRAKVAEMNDGTDVTIPVMAMVGRRPGPVVLLSGAIHGDEYNGPATIHKLFAELSPDGISGALIGVPIMSPFSYFARARSNVLDYEHLNLNRVWPGDRDGFLTQRAAAAVFDGIVRHVDYVMDLHEGGIAFIAEYLLIGGSASTKAKVGAKQLEMARWFGHGVPIVEKTTDDMLARLGRLGTMTEAAGSLGKPVLTIETGGGGTLWPKYVDLAASGVRRVLTGLGVLPGPLAPDNRRQVLVNDSAWPRPSRGGFVKPAPGIDMHVEVKKGAPLCTIHDVFGEAIDTVVAPYDSVILDTRFLATVYPGDWTYHCGKL